MSKSELIAFAILSVFAAVMAFDFIVFVLKSAPKRAYFPSKLWGVGMLCVMALVYWAMNGCRFL